MLLVAGYLDYRFVLEMDPWRVVLAPNQYRLGRCVAHLKRHCGGRVGLTPAELSEWLKVVGMLAGALRLAFGATMFNWSCYMHHSYRDNPLDPHVHWWSVPMSDHPVTEGSWMFEDPDFGSPYEHTRWLDVAAEVRQELVAGVQRAIPG